MKHCKLITTKKTHSSMVEKHGEISDKGCQAAQGRKFKKCKECKEAADLQCEKFVPHEELKDRR